MQWIGKNFFKFGLDVNFFLKGVAHDKVHLKLKDQGNAIFRSLISDRLDQQL